MCSGGFVAEFCAVREAAWICIIEGGKICVQVLGSKRAVRGLIWWIGVVFEEYIIMREEEMRGSIS